MEGDARVTLADEATASADLLVGDAFGARAIPWHLATVEYAREIRRVLRPRGLYALNLIDQPPLKLARAEVATLRAVFADVALVALPSAAGRPAGGNLVLLASETALPRGVRPASRGARTYDRRAAARFAAGAEPLRDLDAPADQLLSRGLEAAAQPLHREGRLRERPDRQVHERERVVVAGDAVQAHGVAPAAAVDERPFAVAADADGDRLHRAGAVRGAVAGNVVVEVPAPQAGRAVVAVPRARRVHRHVEPAAAASEGVLASAPDTVVVALVARQGGTSGK